MSEADRASLGERIARGEEAARILENETVQLALSMAQAEIMDEWLQGPGGPEEGQRAHASVHALGQFERQLRVVVSDGQLARDARESQGD